MPTEYFKRHRMGRDLATPVSVPALPAGYRWRPWHELLVDVHADVLRQAFHGEADAVLFPNLGCESGCRMLTRAIRDCSAFCPEATWLIDGPGGAVGAIQSLIEAGDGSIQNIAVVPECRGLGLGTALLLRAMASFQALGVPQVELEVTVVNSSAMALYRRLGFRAYKTIYRTADVPDRSMVGLGI